MRCEIILHKALSADGKKFVGSYTVYNDEGLRVFGKSKFSKDLQYLRAWCNSAAIVAEVCGFDVVCKGLTKKK